MSQINPFTGAVSQTPQLQRLQAADKAQQVRRLQNQYKNAAAAGEALEHQVESAGAIVSIHEDEQHPDQKREKQPHRRASTPETSDDKAETHLDLTA